MTYYVQKINNWEELCMWVIYMTHFKDAMKSDFTDHNFSFFAQAGKSNLKNFRFTEFKIKFPIY